MGVTRTFTRPSELLYTIACGLPMLTQVTLHVLPATCNAAMYTRSAYLHDEQPSSGRPVLGKHSYVQTLWHTSHSVHEKYCSMLKRASLQQHQQGDIDAELAIPATQRRRLRRCPG